MLLVIEVGNTNTKIGVFDGERLLVSWRLTSRREQTADEYGAVHRDAPAHARARGPPRSTGVAISNVVPPVQQTLEWMCEKYFGRRRSSSSPASTRRIPLDVDNPREVGADRVVKAVAARRHLRSAADRDRLRHRHHLRLRQRAGRVHRRRHRPRHRRRPSTPCSTGPLASSASSWCGPRTRSAATPSPTSSPGLIYGYAGLVDGLVERMKARDGRARRGWSPRAATPRSSSNVARSIENVHEHLALEGLRLLCERAQPRLRRTAVDTPGARSLYCTQI